MERLSEVNEQTFNVQEYKDAGLKETVIFEKVTPEQAMEIAKKYYRYDKIANLRVANLDDVNDEQVRQYRANGYIVVENAISAEQIKGALNEIDDIIHGRLKGPSIQLIKPKNSIQTPEEMDFAVRKISNYVKDSTHLRNIACHPGIVAVTEKLLGDKAKLVGEQGLLKPPYGGGEKPWHQDMAYGGLFYRKQILSVWIALDPADLDNGCMHIIPKSHLRGGLPHYAIRDWQVCDHHVDIENDEAVVMKPGSALFFSGLLLHGTPANFSSKRRRALQVRFAPASSKFMSKDEFKIMFTNEMTEVEC